MEGRISNIEDTLVNVKSKKIPPTKHQRNLGHHEKKHKNIEDRRIGRIPV